MHHHAPALSYPVGASVLYSVLVLSMAGLGILAWILWVYLADTLVWAHHLAMVLNLLLWLWAFRAWRRGTAAQLSWDGQNWSLVGHSGAVSVRPQVVLDFQRYLLLFLRVEAPNRNSYWVWPAASSQPARWPALRWALFARANGKTDPDAVPAQDALTHLNR
jgi:hypothetical protein